MVYTSLMEAPRNLKEAIDWLMTLKGDDSKIILQSVGGALYRILANTNVGLVRIPDLEKVKRLSKEFMEQKELKDRSLVYCLLRKFNGPMNKTDGMDIKRFCVGMPSDYENVIKTRRLHSGDLAKDVGRIVGACDFFLKYIKNSALYESAYSPDVTWRESCSKNPEACALVLVGFAPMLYAGIQALWDATEISCCDDSADVEQKRFVKVMKALGYGESDWRSSMTRLNVRSGLRAVDQEILFRIYDLAGIWAFY